MGERVEVRRVVIPYSPRTQFKPFHDRTQRFAAIVAHRRAGKTVACINDLIRAALICPREAPRFAYLAPYLKQAKAVVWDYLLKYSAAVPGYVPNHSELRVDYPNGGRVRLFGADNADALRGIYLDGVVLDEPADMDPRVWAEIIRPTLVDRAGWAVFIGTPKGHNQFHEIYMNAEASADWYAAKLKASETGLIPPAELAMAKADMTDDQYAQEFECSFEAAIQGAYYGKLINRAEADKRITNVPYEPKIPVHTAWDLGIGDPTAIWFVQQVGAEVRLIDYYEASGVELGHYVKVLKEKPYTYGKHYLPHDADVKELGTGTTRIETLRGLGLVGQIVPKQSVDDGINAVRLLLPKCYFDKTKCERGLEALRQYRTDFDEKLKTFKPHPLHDWTSHAADAFRYLATGIKPDVKIKPIQYPQARRV